MKKEVSQNELEDVGILQEANRLFFHPHGYELAVQNNELKVFDIIDVPVSLPSTPMSKIKNLHLRARRYAEVRRDMFTTDPWWDQNKVIQGYKD